MTDVRTRLRRARRIGGGLLAALALGVAVASLSAPASAFADAARSGPSQTTSCVLRLPCFKLQASPGTLDFGAVAVGASSPARTVRLSNVGDAAGRVSAATASAAFVVDRSGCPARLAPGTSCSLAVRFAPGSTGSKDGTLMVAGAGAVGGGTTAVHLSGTGEPAGQIAVSPTSLDFGNVPVGSTAKAQTVFVTNVSGEGSVKVTDASASGGGFDVSPLAAGCDALQPGDSCGVDVTFTPARGGAAHGTLTITTDDAGSQTVELSGSGINEKRSAGLSVTPTSLAFGAVPVGQRATARSVTVKNTGDATDEVNTVSTTEPFSANGSACVTKALSPGGTCTIQVTFAPTAGGDASGTLRIATQNGGSATVSLSGSGATSAFTVTPRALSFGAVPVGQRSAIKTETVRSTGDLSVTVESVSDPRFTVDATACVGHTLAPHRSCTVRVSFAPLAAGPVTDNLVITTSAGRFTVALSGTGSDARVGGVHTGPRPGDSAPSGNQPGVTQPGVAQPGVSDTGAPAGEALVAGLALLAAGAVLQVAGALRRRAAAVVRPPEPKNDAGLAP